MSLGHPVVTVTLNPAIDQTLAIPGFAAGEEPRRVIPAAKTALASLIPTSPFRSAGSAPDLPAGPENG
jgi:hypothetical protein